MSITDLLTKLVSADTIEDAWALHTEKMAEYGFDRLIYSYSRFSMGNSLGDLQDALILTNHDPEYVDFFFGEGMSLSGPLVSWASETIGASSWRTTIDKATKGELGPKEMEAMAINQRLGVVAGYTINFLEISLRAKGAIVMTARRGLSQDDIDEVWNEHGMDIELANKVMHLKVSQLPHTTGQRRKMTARQREVLEWIADGKTIQDTATLMGLNPATIEKHLRLARESLDVETTAQAILKAASQNQFFLIER